MNDKWIAILNDGTFDGDAPLMYWTQIPIGDDEVDTINLEEIAELRKEAFVKSEEDLQEWDDIFADENQSIKRAFIVEKSLWNNILESTMNVSVWGDGESYVMNSTLLAVLAVISKRVVV